MKHLLFLLAWFFTIPYCFAQDTNWVKLEKSGCEFSDPFPSDSSRYQWNGACKGGKIDGKGVLKKLVGEDLIYTYEGNTKDGFFHGIGKLTFYNNIIYEGNFIGGELTGQGKVTGDNGDRYEGQLIGYKYHGVGQLRVNSEYSFSGILRLGVIYSGTLTTKTGEKIFYERGEVVNKPPSMMGSSYYPPMNKEVKEYFNSDWERTTPEQASYYRIITYQAPNTPKGYVKEYKKDGSLYAAFKARYICYEDDSRNYYDGFYLFYYPNEEVKLLLQYKRGLLNGRSSSYYESGEKEKITEYRSGELNGLYAKWFPNGKLNYFAFYEEGKLYRDRYYEFDEEDLGESVNNIQFKNQESVWAVEREGAESIITEDNTVLIKSKNEKSGLLLYQYLEFDREKNFRIKMDIGRVGGKGVGYYGLIFGYKDDDNFNRFMISSKGAFSIRSVYKGIENEIYPLTNDASIKSGNATNQLSIYQIGEKMYFTINGKIVHRDEAPPIASNQFGCVVTGSGEFELQLLEIREMMSPEEITEVKSILEKYNEEDGEEDWSASGSGFFISETGLIATNYHVVEDGSEIFVELQENGKSVQYPAEVVASDPSNDLAIIKINKAGFQTGQKIPYSLTSQSLDVGTSVFTLGYPHLDVMGREVKYNKGEISSKTGVKGDVTRYQISVPIQPGNSGGPLFDEKGNLVGIVCAKLSSEYGAENVNYAIKSAYLKILIESLSERVIFKPTNTLSSLSATDRIKVLSKFIPIILVR